MLEDDFSSVIEQCKVCGLHVDLPNKLLQFSGVLKSWAGSRFLDLPKKIQVLRAELQDLLHSSKDIEAVLSHQHMWWTQI